MDVLLEFGLILAEVMPDSPSRPHSADAKTAAKSAEMRFQRVTIPGSIIPLFDVHKVIHANLMTSDMLGL